MQKFSKMQKIINKFKKKMKKYFDRPQIDFLRLQNPQTSKKYLKKIKRNIFFFSKKVKKHNFLEVKVFKKLKKSLERIKNVKKLS